MTRKHLAYVLAVSIFLFGAHFANAAEHAPGATAKPVATESKVPATQVKPARKPVSKGKLVDINGANKAALKKLPGITDALADKIIANRPYGSKAWLVSNGVIDQTTYGKISGQIEAKQPFKTAAENVAFYEKLKKEKAAKP